MLFGRDPILDEEKMQASCELINSKRLTMGERVPAFERAFAELHIAERAVVANASTVKLNLMNSKKILT